MTKKPKRPDEVRESAPSYPAGTRRPRGAIRRMTIEEFERMSDEDAYRHELVRGWLVREPPPVELHGSIQIRLGHYLFDFVERNRLGLVVTESGSVLSERQQTVRGPDVAFVAAARLEGGPRRKCSSSGPPSRRAAATNATSGPRTVCCSSSSTYPVSVTTRPSLLRSTNSSR